MPTINVGSTGAVVSPGEPGFGDTAVRLESLGYSTIWLTGGPMSSLDQVAAVVRATRAATVATGIISVDRFPADAVIATSGELERTHPGRFAPGLGGAHGADPMGTLHAYLDQLDDAIPASGRFLAALGPRMLRLARDRSAGAFPVLVTPAYTARAREILGADRLLAVNQLVVLETDPAAARRAARGPVGFLGKLPAYKASFLRQGFASDVVDDLADPLIDALVAWGDVEAIAKRIGQLRTAGADHVAVNVVAPPGVDPGPQWEVLAGALLGS